MNSNLHCHSSYVPPFISASTREFTQVAFNFVNDRQVLLKFPPPFLYIVPLPLPPERGIGTLIIVFFCLLIIYISLRTSLCLRYSAAEFSRCCISLAVFATRGEQVCVTYTTGDCVDIIDRSFCVCALCVGSFVTTLLHYI